MRPIQLKKSPIVDSICDMRFDSSLPLDIVPGVIVNALNSLEMKDLQKLPVLDIPESMRAADPNLLHAPYYHAKIGDITIQLGGRMIALSSPLPYIGWNSFRPQIREIIKVILDTGVISKVVRVAVRNVNFFGLDILDNSKYAVQTPIEHDCSQYHYTDYYNDGDLTIKTTIANKAIRHEPESEPIEGSVIDIDSYIENSIDANLDMMLSNIDKAHLEGKNIFFDLLNDDFIETLEPKYD